jgi:hypothetical protein
MNTLRLGNVSGSKNQTLSASKGGVNKPRSSLHGGLEENVSEENVSEENILPLHGNGFAKTAVLTVENSSSSLEEPPERQIWSRGMEVAPERKIEDRV